VVPPYLENSKASVRTGLRHFMVNNNWTNTGYDIIFVIALILAGMLTFFKGIYKVCSLDSGHEKNFGIRLMLVQIFLKSGLLLAAISFWLALSTGFIGSLIGNGYYCMITLSIWTFYESIMHYEDCEEAIKVHIWKSWGFPIGTYVILVIFETSLEQNNLIRFIWELLWAINILVAGFWLLKAVKESENSNEELLHNVDRWFVGISLFISTKVIAIFFFQTLI
jgi:flagellar biogenesis protein FliO